jgi:putative intracellular protease/amidase
VACILSDDFEDSEFRIPYDRLRAEGFQVDLIGRAAGDDLKGKKGKERVKVEKGIDDVRPDDYQALFIPGGYSPHTCASTGASSSSRGRLTNSTRPWRPCATGRSCS